MQQVSLKRILLILSPVIIIVGVGYYVKHPSEPHYRGRPLSQWRADLDEGKPDAVRQRAEATLIEAAQEAAPNSIKGLQAKDSQFRLTLAGWAKRVGLHIRTANERRSRAFGQFLQFGVGAIPVLTNLLQNPELALGATKTLSRLCPAAVDPLVGALQNTNGTIRMVAAQGLANVYLTMRLDSVKGPTNTIAIALVTCLQDPSPVVRREAARFLGWMEEESLVVVPALIEVLDGTNGLYARTAAVEALGRFGEKATAAVPRLRELSRAEDPLLRQSAEEALRKIEN